MRELRARHDMPIRIILLICCVLSACGQTGDLYRRDAAAPDERSGRSAPPAEAADTPEAAAEAADKNKDEEEKTTPGSTQLEGSQPQSAPDNTTAPVSGDSQPASGSGAP